MIDFLAHISVITNSAIIYFTSYEYRQIFIYDAKDPTTEFCLGLSSKYCVTMPIEKKLFSNTVGFALFVVAIEHGIYFIKVIINKIYSENFKES
jgi:hypothetical protein